MLFNPSHQRILGINHPDVSLDINVANCKRAFKVLEAQLKEADSVSRVKATLNEIKRIATWRGPLLRDIVNDNFYCAVLVYTLKLKSGVDCQMLALDLISTTVQMHPESITRFIECGLVEELRTLIEYRGYMSPVNHDFCPLYVLSILSTLALYSTGIDIVIGEGARHKSFFELSLDLLDEIWGEDETVQHADGFPYRTESRIYEFLGNVAQWKCIDSSFRLTVIACYQEALSRGRVGMEEPICNALHSLWTHCDDVQQLISDNEALVDSLCQIVNNAEVDSALSSASFLVRGILVARPDVSDRIDPHSLSFTAEKYGREAESDVCDESLLLLAEKYRIDGGQWTDFDHVELASYCCAQMSEGDGAHFTRKGSVSCLLLAMIGALGEHSSIDTATMQRAIDWAQCGSSHLAGFCFEAIDRLTCDSLRNDALRESVGHFAESMIESGDALWQERGSAVLQRLRTIPDAAEDQA